MLSNVASKLSTIISFTHDTFFMEIVFMLSVSDNIMYHDNNQMINLLHL